MLYQSITRYTGSSTELDSTNCGSVTAEGVKMREGVKRGSRGGLELDSTNCGSVTAEGVKMREGFKMLGVKSRASELVE